MPYKVSSDLPQRIRDVIPCEKGQNLFMSAYNDQFETKKSEDLAYAYAWDALSKAGYKKCPKGKYQLDKTQPTVAQVHSGGVMGGGGKPKKIKGVTYKQIEDEIDACKTYEAVEEVISKYANALKEIYGEDEPESKPVEKQFEVHVDILETIEKSDERKVVYGWASVIEENGQPLVDTQGDVITEDDLITSVHKFMSESRHGKAMHKGDQIGEVVESVILTRDLQKQLGINISKIGWLVGMKINDDAVWNKIKSGEYQSFSIGGRAERHEIV